MKKNLLSSLAVILLFFFAPAGFAQKQVSMKEGAMPLMSQSQQAKKLTTMGIAHMMNVERELAYNNFKAAVELDPNLSVALAYLANLSRGEAQKEFARRALSSAQSEGEQLFAQIVQGSTTPEVRRENWAKLHALYPNDLALGYVYAFSRATPDERFAALTDFLNKHPEESSVYNQLGYLYMNDKKDMAKAKECFEKYIQLNPNSANPYDSMGEFYLNNGDVENAEKYYNMALEKYPFMVSSLLALDKIAEKKKMGKN